MRDRRGRQHPAAMAARGRVYQTQAGPLLTNHATKVFFAGASDAETLRYVSMLGGDEEVVQRWPAR